MNKEANGRAPVERRVSKRCGNCAHIGEHGWGLPSDEKQCQKIKDRQEDFDLSPARNSMDAIDNFRFRPTDGVLPYSSAERCRHYKPANAKVG